MKSQSCPVKSEASGSAIVVRVPGEGEVQWFDGLLADHHYLGAGRPVGDYLLQIKGNQPNLLKQAHGLDTLPDTPFLPRPIRDTDASRLGNCLPLPSNRSPRIFPMPER